jgi:hypothetical protein
MKLHNATVNASDDALSSDNEIGMSVILSDRDHFRETVTQVDLFVGARTPHIRDALRPLLACMRNTRRNQPR